SQGDTAGAVHALRTSAASVAMAMASAPASMVADLSDESRELDELLADVRDGQVSRAAKSSSATAARKSRTRGRPTT
ncbi:MAG: hypothetical protein GX427_13870, partial [Actinomycetales bacterium]|nr:hypothetical protein [Actinomycetales bacterium]